MARKNTWANQMKKSRTALKLFCKFMSKQDKIVYADDMVPGLHYTYITSTNGMDTDRCILWGGIRSDIAIIKDLINTAEFDAQLNIEVQPFCNNDGGGCFVYIAQHKIGCRLHDIDSWVWKHEDG